jgi:hypothetical protein
MWLPGWIITEDLVFLSGLIVGSVVVANLFIVAHDTIHRQGISDSISEHRNKSDDGYPQAD